MIGEYRNEVSDKLIQIQHDKCIGLLFLINYTHTGGKVISIKGLSKISSKLVVYIYRKEANLLLELIQNFIIDNSSSGVSIHQKLTNSGLLIRWENMFMALKYCWT